MEIQADFIAASASLIAAAFSFYFYFQSKKLTAKIREDEKQIQQGVFHFDRTSSYVEKLYECPECLKFYGIDLEEIEKDGITYQQVAYLAQSITALVAQCISKNIDISEYISTNQYRQWIFQQQETKKVWKYVRLIFSDNVQDSLDKYLG